MVGVGGVEAGRHGGRRGDGGEGAVKLLLQLLAQRVDITKCQITVHTEIKMNNVGSMGLVYVFFLREMSFRELTIQVKEAHLPRKQKV